MTREELIKEIYRKKSFLCVGLDTELKKLPSCVMNSDDPVFEFNRRIIDATKDHCVSYKINTAFYEAMGTEGWECMQKTIYYIGKSHFIIADAKRGDIGNTSDQYAQAFFKKLPCDSVTVAPYMGKDSVQSFLNYPGKFAIVLGLTSNESAADFQTINDEHGVPLYLRVIEKAASWGTEDNMMFVVGATKAEWLREIRKVIPNHFLLVPGVGAQGGSLEEVVKFGKNQNVGLLVNSSRGIIYASSADDFDIIAKQEAAKIHQQMMNYC